MRRVMYEGTEYGECFCCRKSPKGPETISQSVHMPSQKRCPISIYKDIVPGQIPGRRRWSGTKRLSMMCVEDAARSRQQRGSGEGLAWMMGRLITPTAKQGAKGAVLSSLHRRTTFRWSVAP